MSSIDLLTVNDIDSLIGNIDNANLFEAGDISISTSGWTYLNNDTRIRTKKGSTLHLEAGTKIGLTDYSTYRYYLGWLDGNGNYGLAGWLTADYTTTVEGDYVVLITTTVGASTADFDTLAGLFYGYRVPAFDYINENISNINSLSKIYYEKYSGYISGSGAVLSAGIQQELYTDMIYVEAGDTMHIELHYSTAYSMWAAYSLYDENGTFISRPIILADITIANMSTTITIPTGVSYIRLTWRSWGDADIEAYTLNRESGPLWWSQKLLQTLNSEINQNINSVNHRGYNSVAPENTLPAYKLSKKKGFFMVETDVQFTSDGVAVCLHDASINRTARNADGTELSETINIADITYETALTYDFGIWMGSDYADTPIPTFEEFIALCRNIGLHPYIELKAGTQAQVEALVDTVINYGMKNKVTWISFTAGYLGFVKDKDSSARLGLVVDAVTSEIVSSAQALKLDTNEVFIDSATCTSTECELCINADLPLEVWTYDSGSQIVALNPYVSGVTSDNLIAGTVLYTNNL